MFPNDMKTITDFQEFHKWFDRLKGFGTDIQFNFVLLTGEVGEVAQVLKQVWWRASTLEAEMAPEQALSVSMGEYKQELAYELADCLAYVFKLANNAGIDLNHAYLEKMAKNVDRKWEAPAPPQVGG